MKTTLNLWIMPNADFDTKEIMGKELAHFRSEHKGIDVQFEVIPWLYSWPRIVKAYKEKGGVDVMMLGSTWVQTLASIGALQNLDGLSIDMARFIPAFRDVCTYKRSLWAIPWFCDAKLLYYRKDHLKAAGIEPGSLSTWNGFLEACGALAKRRSGGKKTYPTGFSIQAESVLAQDLSCFIWSAGGDFISPDGKRPALSDPQTRTGLKTLLHMIDSGFISKLSLQHTSGDVIADFFCKDAYTFVFSGPWANRVYLNSGVETYIGDKRAENIGVMILPGGKAGRFNFFGGATAAISSFSKNRREAEALLKFFAGAESQKRYCARINAIAGRTDVGISLPFMSGYKDIYRDAVMEYGRTFPQHPLWGAIEGIIVSGVAEALNEYSISGSEAAFYKAAGSLDGEIAELFGLFGDKE